MSSAVSSAPDCQSLSRKGELSDSHEIEIKFMADAATLDSVRQLPEIAAATVPDAHRLVTIYYDTPEDDLRRAGHTLRIRRKGDALPKLSVKSQAVAGEGPFHRHELEVTAPDGLPSLGLLLPEIRAALSAAISKRPLLPRFDVHVERTAILLTHRSSVIEIALDRGKIVGGAASEPVSELELELKSGTVGDLLDFASHLTRQFPLQLDFVSKSERGYRLLSGDPPSPVKAAPVDLPRHPATATAMATVIANALAHFVANWAALRQTTAPESVHQARVALRRMRSALGILAKVLPDEELERLRAVAKQLASGLGPARECDVFLGMAAAGPLASPDCPAGGKAFLALLHQYKENAYAGARQLIDDRETALFVFSVQAFIVRTLVPGPEAEQGSLQELQEEAAEFAAKALDRLDKRARKRGAGMPELGDEARHDLRIALKNLRYGAEFFGGLFGRTRKAKAFGKSVSILQDFLGAHNDVVTARRLVGGMNIAPGTEEAGAAAFTLGWLARDVPLAEDELHRAWREFEHAPRFWR